MPWKAGCFGQAGFAGTAGQPMSAMTFASSVLPECGARPLDLRGAPAYFTPTFAPSARHGALIFGVLSGALTGKVVERVATRCWLLETLLGELMRATAELRPDQYASPGPPLPETTSTSAISDTFLRVLLRVLHYSLRHACLATIYRLHSLSVSRRSRSTMASCEDCGLPAFACWATNMFWLQGLALGAEPRPTTGVVLSYLAGM